MSHKVFKQVLPFIKIAVTLSLVFALGRAGFELWGRHSQRRIENQAARLDRLRPYLGKFLQKNGDPVRWEKRRINEFIVYYEEIRRYMPHRAETYGMLGFFHALAGESQQAINFYKQSIQLNPRFFWFHYNLGVLYLQSGLYEQAEEAFKNAMEVPMDETLQLTLSSNVYLQLFAAVGQPDIASWLAGRLQLAHHRCLEGLLIAQYHQKKYNEMAGLALLSIRSAPQEGIFYYYEGVAALAVQEYQSAYVFLKEYLNANSDDPQVVRYLGLCAQALRGETVSLAALGNPLKEERVYGQMF